MLGLYRISRLFSKRELDCTEVRKLSSEYLDETLAPPRLQKVRAHLSACPPCQTFVDGVASVVGMLTKLPGMQSPPNLRQSIMERTEKEGGGSGKTK